MTSFSAAAGTNSFHLAVPLGLQITFSEEKFVQALRIDQSLCARVASDLRDLYWSLCPQGVTNFLLLRNISVKQLYGAYLCSRSNRWHRCRQAVAKHQYPSLAPLGLQITSSDLRDLCLPLCPQPITNLLLLAPQIYGAYLRSRSIGWRSEAFSVSAAVGNNALQQLCVFNIPGRFSVSLVLRLGLWR